MKEIPILFSTEMVQAILEVRKTMTRRIVKPQIRNGVTLQFHPDGYYLQRSDVTGLFDNNHLKCKYGQPGDVLWVRETMVFNKNSETYWPVADGYLKTSDYEKVVPSIHVPKKHSRIWLQVEEIRLERLQEISEEDAVAEGAMMVTFTDGDIPPSIAFRFIWKLINGEESWDVNPWVWVIKFKVLSTTGKPQLETLNLKPETL